MYIGCQKVRLVGAGMLSLTVAPFAEQCRYAVRSDWHLIPITCVSEAAIGVALSDCTPYEAFLMFVGQLL